MLPSAQYYFICTDSILQIWKSFLSPCFFRWIQSRVARLRMFNHPEETNNFTQPLIGTSSYLTCIIVSTMHSNDSSAAVKTGIRVALSACKLILHECAGPCSWRFMYKNSVEVSNWISGSLVSVHLDLTMSSLTGSFLSRKQIGVYA
jgi:hypothetical protein